MIFKGIKGKEMSKPFKKSGLVVRVNNDESNSLFLTQSLTVQRAN